MLGGKGIIGSVNAVILVVILLLLSNTSGKNDSLSDGVTSRHHALQIGYHSNDP